MTYLLKTGLTMALKRGLSLGLLLLLCWWPLAPAWAEVLTLPENTRQAQLQATEVLPPDTNDYWMNATYALGGAATGNALAGGMIIVAGGLGSAFSATPPEDVSGVWMASLLVLPMLLTPTFMHLFSPESDPELFYWSLLGSSAAAVLHALLMIPLFVLFGQGNGAETFYLLAPAAFVSAVLFESLGAAWGHQLGEGLKFEGMAGGGLQLSQQFVF